MVILPGFLGSVRNWNTIGRRLCDEIGIPVYALDLRNHGNSIPSSRHSNFTAREGEAKDNSVGWYPMSWSHYVADIQRFINAQDLKSVILVGHSFGGQVAMKSAWWSPKFDHRLDNHVINADGSIEMVEPFFDQNAISQLVIVDIAPRPAKFEGSSVQVLLKALMEIDREQYTRRSDAEAHLRHFESSEAIIQFLLSNLKRCDGEDKVGKLGFAIPLKGLHQGMTEMDQSYNTDIPPRASSIPTLFIRGGISEYIKDTDIDLITLLFSKGEVVTIPNTGHWVHYDATDEFVGRVKEFVKNINSINE